MRSFKLVKQNKKLKPRIKDFVIQRKKENKS